MTQDPGIKGAIAQESEDKNRQDAMKTIKQGSMRSIKEVKRKGNPMHFDFESVENESNDKTIERVKAFIRDSPSAVSKLADGSFYHGNKLDGKPAGTGFVAVYDD